MNALHEELAEIELRAHVERSRARLENDRRERAMPPREGFGSARLGRGSIVFPDLLSISSVSAVPVGTLGPGTLGGITAGPVSFSSGTDDRGSSASMIGFAPSVDVFAGDRFTIGGRIHAVRTSATRMTPNAPPQEHGGYALGFAPRVGYLVPLFDGIAFWPQLALSVSVARNEHAGLGRDLSRAIGAELEMGFIAPIGRHIVARLAPTLAYSHAWNESLWNGDTDTVRAGFRAQLGVAF